MNRTFDPPAGAVPRRPAVLLVLACLALAAWFMANMIHRVIEEDNRPIPSLPVLAARGPADLLPAEPPDDEGWVDRDFFSAGGEAPVPPEPEPPPSDPLPPVRLPVALVGTVVSSDARWSLALVADQRTRTTELHRRGDLLAGRARIVQILADRVIVDVDGQELVLTLAARQGPLVPQASAAGSEVDLLSGLVRATGANRFRVNREGLEALLSRPAELARQARVAMAFSGDGTIEGIRLTGLGQNSVLGQLGLKRADVLRRVNGHALDSPERILEVYQRLRDASRIDVEVDSGGRRRTLRFSIE